MGHLQFTWFLMFLVIQVLFFLGLMKHISNVGDAGATIGCCVLHAGVSSSHGPSRPSAAQFGSFWLAASLANKLMRLGTADPSHDFLNLAPKVWQFEGRVDVFPFQTNPHGQNCWLVMLV